MDKVLADHMVYFIYKLMSLVDPEIDTLNENERKEFILLFIQSAGLLELTKCEQSGDVVEITAKIYELMEGGTRNGQSYLSIALDCLSRRGGCGANNKWHYFATSLAAIFSHEDKFFFRWLSATIKAINFGVEYLPFQEIDSDFQSTAILFALETVLHIDVERCAEHYLSLNRLRPRLH
jgi:hypothetical protein